MQRRPRFGRGIGWDYFHLMIGGYWFVIDIGWMSPLVSSDSFLPSLGYYARVGWNTRRIEFIGGNPIWEHADELIPQRIQETAF